MSRGARLFASGLSAPSPQRCGESVEGGADADLPSHLITVELSSLS